VAAIEPGGDPPSLPRKSKPLLRSRPAIYTTPKQLVKMLKRQAKLEEKCRHAPLDPHTCPYLVDTLKDKRTKCRCCEACQELCANQI
jgi:flavoprotein